MIGDTLGNYRVVSRLGMGGMGAVYIGEHTLIGRKAAIKILLPEFSRKQEIVERFFNEAKAGSAIGHPGIVQTIDFGYHTDGSAYLVMELLTGEPLNERLDRLGKMPEDEAVRIARQCASALAAAHKAGIIHRDLKPANIFLSEDPEMEAGERVKILDFGIAKLTDSGAAGDLRTRTGSMMGTPVYMSPEQCRGAGLVDHRSDIYSLGCVLFRMLCGRPPFVAEGIGEIIASHLREPPPSMQSFVPTISPALDAVVQRTLAKAPEARFSSMEEMASVLQSLRQGGALQPSRGGHQRHGSSGELHRHQLALPAAQPAVAALPPAHAPRAMPGRNDRARSDMTTTPLDAHAAQAVVTMPDHTTLGAVASQRMQAHQRKSRRGLVITSALVATAGLVGILVAVIDQPVELEARPVPDTIAAVQPDLAAGSVSGAAATGGSGDAPEPGTAAAPGSAGSGDSAPPPEPDQARAAATQQPAEAETAPAAVPGAQPATVVRIESTPDGAAVHAPGKRKPIGTTPLEYTLPAGASSMTLSVRHDDYKTEQIEVVAGRTRPFKVTLQRERKPERPPQRSEPKPARKPRTYNDDPLKNM
jgi:serine/threonine protein kinase